MIDLVKLRKTIQESGLKISAISEQMSIARETLYNKLNGKTEFTVSEIIAISNILGLTKTQRDNIFFAKK